MFKIALETKCANSLHENSFKMRCIYLSFVFISNEREKTPLFDFFFLSKMSFIALKSIWRLLHIIPMLLLMCSNFSSLEKKGTPNCFYMLLLCIFFRCRTSCNASENERNCIDIISTVIKIRKREKEKNSAKRKKSVYNLSREKKW